MNDEKVKEFTSKLNLLLEEFKKDISVSEMAAYMVFCGSKHSFETAFATSGDPLKALSLILNSIDAAVFDFVN